LFNTNVVKNAYAWNDEIFGTALDHFIYVGSYSDWGINVELVTGTCNPI
jgi:hypothetical protein